MSHVECFRISDVSANNAVTIFRLNVYWLFKALNRVDSRWKMEFEGFDWRNRVAGCCSVGNEHVAEEKR
jgi:hypothetical protein